MKVVLASTFGPAILTLLGLASCAAQQESLTGEPLPFHLALMPTEMLDTSVTATLAGSEPVAVPRDADNDMRLALAAPEVSQALARNLERAFTRTTLLAPPEDEQRYAAMNEVERDLWWQERARAAGADLLLRTRLLYDPRIEQERNEKFWLNLPLFLIGGPMCYFVGDRSYRVSARLQGEIYEISAEHLELDPFALLQLPLYVEAAEEDLRFLDRADGAGHYAASLIVPAGLLARRTAHVERELEQRVPHSLGNALTSKVFAGRAELERKPELGGFLLEAGSVRAVGTGDGRTRLTIPVRELGGYELLHYELRAGEQLLARGDFSERPPDRRHVIEMLVELPPDEPFLRVKLVDTASNTRGYTLPLHAGR